MNIVNYSFSKSFIVIDDRFLARVLSDWEIPDQVGNDEL